jgi:hypothetical protein
MSALVREPDDNGSLNDGALHDAPKGVRQVEHDQNRESAAPSVNTAPRPDTLEPPAPPWKRKKRRGAFAGDVAVVELHTKLALAPDRITEPLPDSAARVFDGVGRSIGVIAVVATGAVGYLWGQAQRTTLPSQQFSTFSDRADSAPEPSVSVAHLNASSLDSKRAAVRPAARALAPGAASDAGRFVPNGATSVTAAPTASATQFNEQDSRPPTPPQAVRQQPEVNAAGIAFMMKSGADLMENGDIAGARLMFQRAAETGDAGAAFALAETYDPMVLGKLGRRLTIISDVALAQSWYKKASDLGSTLAQERIVRLTQRVE